MNNAGNPINWISTGFHPHVQILAWECPVCHIGIRGDVEVCPNCVSRNAHKAKPHLTGLRPIAESGKD